MSIILFIFSSNWPFFPRAASKADSWFVPFSWTVLHHFRFMHGVITHLALQPRPINSLVLPWFSKWKVLNLEFSASKNILFARTDYRRLRARLPNLDMWKYWVKRHAWCWAVRAASMADVQEPIPSVTRQGCRMPQLTLSIALRDPKMSTNVYIRRIEAVLSSYLS